MFLPFDQHTRHNELLLVPSVWRVWGLLGWLLLHSKLQVDLILVGFGCYCQQSCDIHLLLAHSVRLSHFIALGAGRQHACSMVPTCTYFLLTWLTSDLYAVCSSDLHWRRPCSPVCGQNESSIISEVTCEYWQVLGFILCIGMYGGMYCGTYWYVFRGHMCKYSYVLVRIGMYVKMVCIVHIRMYWYVLVYTNLYWPVLDVFICLGMYGIYWSVFVGIG